MGEVKGWDDLAEIANYTPPENLLLLDGNNVAFRWLHRPNYNNFGDDYLRTVQSLAKSYDAKRAIVCFDFGKSYFRKSFFDEYKANRKPPEDVNEAKRYDEFFQCLNKIADELPVEKYKLRGVEADDLITFFVNHLSPKHKRTWIISSDKDIYQLVSETVSIFNLFSQQEITDDYIFEKFGVSPEDYLLMKIIEGDPRGDNIPGIEGIGPKRAASLVKTYQNFDNLLNSLPIKGKSQYIKNLNAGKEILIRNEKLISLFKYNYEAITSGKGGEENWKELEKIVYSED